MSTRTEPITDPDEFTREELNAVALAEGVENAEALRTKADVVAAINERIEARTAGTSRTTSATDTTSRAAANTDSPSGSNPPRDDRDASTTLNTTVVVPTRPTAASVFGVEAPTPGALAFDTSAFQPSGDEPPIYGDARTRTLVDPDGKRLDGGGTVNKSDDNRDRAKAEA